MLQHAAIAGAARVGQQLRPGVGMRGEKAVNQALDPFWIRAVPMPKAMQRAFSAGKRFEIENCGHHNARLRDEGRSGLPSGDRRTPA